jgi:hypothetical protein
MIVLSVPEVLAVAARVLRAPPLEVVEHTDLHAVAVTLEEASLAAGDHDVARAWSSTTSACRSTPPARRSAS